MANMPNPPSKPPSRGNSQQVVPHDVAQQRARPREVHPAVTEFQNRYAQIWDENDRLVADNTRLTKENEVLRQLDAEKSALIDSLRKTAEETQRTTDARLVAQEAHFRDRVAEAERAKERYLRFAVSMSERVQSCISDLQATHDLAMEMAHGSNKPLSDVEKAVADAINLER